MKRWEDFMEDESGMGVVEIILIMVVLIAMCVIFKQQITSLAVSYTHLTLPTN